MHVAFADDRGGNVIETEGSCAGGLHAAWDGCLLRRTLGRDVSWIVTRLQKEITASERAAWEASCPVDRANESFAIAIGPATRYCVAGEEVCRHETGKTVALDDAYVRANGPIVADRLKRAGVRLAHLLDGVLGN